MKKHDRGHPKFLVYYDDVSSARVLFFAEVWQSSFRAKQIRSKPNRSVNLVTPPCTRYSRRVESSAQFVQVYSKSSRKESKTSFCCPLPYYSPDHPYLGKCIYERIRRVIFRLISFNESIITDLMSLLGLLHACLNLLLSTCRTLLYL